MKLNAIEKALMNNPVRSAVQRRYEGPILLSLGGPASGERVLEIGCGRGVGTQIILERFGADHVTAFDLDPDMVERARRRLAPEGDRVEVEVGDAEHIDAPDGDFDAVFDFGIIHHILNWRAAVKEVARVLRPGGRLALWWNEGRGGSWWWEAEQTRIEAGNPRYRRGYRQVDYAAQLADRFVTHPPYEIAWERRIPVDLYERWLRSKSYVQALPDVDGFVAACRADLLQEFPDGEVLEPFVTRVWLMEKR